MQADPGGRLRVAGALVGSLLLTLNLLGCSGNEAARPESLRGTWLLDTVTSVSADLPTSGMHPRGMPSTDAAAVFTFREDGAFSGSGPCNDFGGRYEFDGRSVIFDASMTILLCQPQVVMEVEQAIFSLFGEGGATVLLDGSDSRLVLSVGAVELVLRRSSP